MAFIQTKLIFRCFQPFAYKEGKAGQTVLRLNEPTTIFECGDLCKCGPDCINRLTQRYKAVPLCLYKTTNKGWGVKAMAKIPKNTFIIEYVGELIEQEEANSRAETSFLFDLNLGNGKCIDSYKYGNLARFINHSCDPNTQNWLVKNCHGDPDNLKLW